MLSSKLKAYSIGIVLVDKEKASHSLIVQPTEALTNKSGDLTVYKHQHAEIIGDNRIECVWTDHSDTRSTPPDMVIGEKVQIMRYEETDMYYWYSLGKSNDLRRLEHIEWNISNTAEIDEKPTVDNQLFVIATTRDGYIEIRTPQNREEKALFKIKANFKDGVMSFSDGNGGSWKWNSKSGKITLKAKEVMWKVPKVTINGKVWIMRGLMVTGATKLIGDVMVIGQVTVTGILKVMGIAFAFLFMHL